MGSVSSGHSQSISQYVIGNSGTTLNGSSNTLSFTLGEPIVGLVSAGPSLGQGFWSGAIEVVLGSEDFSGNSGIWIFPNPVSDNMHLVFTDLIGEDFSLQLVDITGRLVFQKSLSNVASKEPLDVSFLTSGTYLLTIQRQENQQLKTIKIIKK